MAGETPQQEFGIEAVEPQGWVPHIKVELVEGSDKISVDAPEGVALHLLTQFRERQDALRQQSMSDARELTNMRRDMLSPGGPRGLVETH